MAGTPKKREKRKALARQAAAATEYLIPPYPGRPEDPSEVPETRKDRVNFVMWLMARGRWVAGPSHHALAEAWGVKVEAIRHYAMEAGHFLEIPPEEIAAARAASIGFFSSIARRAATECNVTTGLPDWRSAIEAQKLADVYSGVAPKESADADRPAVPPQIVVRLLPEPPRLDESAPAPGAAS